MCLSANIVGTYPCTIMRAAASIYADNRVKTGRLTIDRPKEEYFKLLCDDVRENYSALK